MFGRSHNSLLGSSPSTNDPDIVVAVTSSKMPYLYDLPHLLSLPPGFEFRFRYSPDWVSEGIKKLFEENRAPDDLLDTPAYLVFHSLDQEVLLPVRLAEVIEIRRLGSIYYVRFRLGGFPAIDDSVIAGPDSVQDASLERIKDGRKRAIRKETRRLSQIGCGLVGVETDLDEALPPRHHLQYRGDFQGSTGKWLQEDTDRHWAKTTALVREQKGLESVPMFYINGMRRRKKSRDDEVGPEELSETRHSHKERKSKGYGIREGKRYQLRILQWCKDSQPRSQLTCEAPEGTVYVEGTSGFVIGKYDVFDFNIRADNTGFTELLLSVEDIRDDDDSQSSDPDRSEAQSESGNPKQDNNERLRGGAPTDWPKVYSTRVPIKVKYNWARMSVAFMVFILGASLFLAPEWWLGLVSISDPSSFVEKGVSGIGLVAAAIPYSAYLQRLVRAGSIAEGTVGRVIARGGG